MPAKIGYVYVLTEEITELTTVKACIDVKTIKRLADQTLKQHDGVNVQEWVSKDPSAYTRECWSEDGFLCTQTIHRCALMEDWEV